MQKAILLFPMLAISLAFAAELAVTASGKKVVLKNDGTWEVYDPSRHLDVSDVRNQVQRVEIAIKYKDAGWCLKETRSILESEGVSEKAIQDSLRNVPKGGILILQAPESTVHKDDPRRYQYVVLDGKGKTVLSKQGSEADAVPSSDFGLLDLASLSIQRAVEGPLTIQVKNLADGELFEYEVNVK